MAAHRRSYGNSFYRLDELVAGDWVILETAETWYIYKVIDHVIVLPHETWVLNPDPFTEPDADGQQFPTRRIMTLTTCSLANGNAWGNSHRWITFTELYGWMERSAGLPPMIDYNWTGA
jgi:sortase A